MTARLDDLKKQLQQLDELGRSGALSAENLASARAELERQLLAEVMASPQAATPAPGSEPEPVPEPVVPSRAGGRLWAAVIGFVAVVVVAGYAFLGNPKAWSVGPGESGEAQAEGMQMAQIETMVNQLAERLKSRPDDAEGWMMLGRSYAVLGRFAEAVPAYQKVLALRPQDAQAHADLADAKGMLNDRRLDGEPEQLIRKALALDPRNLKALSLAGTIAFQRGDFAQAVKHWELAVATGEPGSELTRNLESGIAEARQRGGLAAAAPTSATPAAAAAGATVGGKVVLSAALKARVSPDDTVFVFARPAQGAKMPLAILKRQVKDLPLDFTLDDSLAMSPAARISGAGQVVVGARISKSGNAMPQPGDLQGLSAPVGVGAKDLVIEIAEEVR